MFGTDIRAIVPQVAMSAGTMIAAGLKDVVMGDHSAWDRSTHRYGGSSPAHGVIEEFETASRRSPRILHPWRCGSRSSRTTRPRSLANARRRSHGRTTMVSLAGVGHVPGRGRRRRGTPRGSSTNWARSCADPESHSRHISMEKAVELGIKVVPLRGGPEAAGRRSSRFITRASRRSQRRPPSRSSRTTTGSGSSPQ